MDQHLFPFITVAKKSRIKVLPRLLDLIGFVKLAAFYFYVYATQKLKKRGHMTSFGPYRIDYTPICWKRAVPVKGRAMWDSQKQEKFMVGVSLSNQHENKPLIEEPVHLEITFHMPRPARYRLLQEGAPHFYTPDLSNLLKFIEDAATGVLWKDDSVITQLTAKKVYSSDPHTSLTIHVLKKGNYASQKKRTPKERIEDFYGKKREVQLLG